MDTYFETAPVIYLVENVAPWEPAVRAFLARDNVRPRISVLTRLECRVQPLRDENAELLEDYEEFFVGLPTGLISLDARVFEKATDLPARHNFSTPDALHLEAAIVNECQLFLTNDGDLTGCTEIQVEVIQP
jgi:predicted nucleic acid-binding protein